MPYGSYVYRSSSGSYYFRLVLPLLAASLLGVRELRRSLATKDHVEARQKALRRTRTFETWFQPRFPMERRWQFQSH